MRILTVIVFFLTTLSVNAQTSYSPMSWGINKGSSPYGFGLNLSGTWYNLGTISSGGVWNIPSSNLYFTQTGTGGVSRTLSAKFLGLPATPDDFGALGGGNDDSTAVENWLNSGLPLTCSKSYTITRVVNVPLTNGGPALSINGYNNSCKIILNPALNKYAASGSAPTVTSAGSGYIVNDELPCSGAVTGTDVACTVHVTGLANNATATATVGGGILTGFTVTYGGSGYSSSYPPAVYVSGDGGCKNAKGYATVVAGAVTSIAVTDAGSSCVSAPTVTIEPPATGPIGSVEVWNRGGYTSYPGTGTGANRSITLGASLRGSSGAGGVVTIPFSASANNPTAAGLNIYLSSGTASVTNAPQIMLHNLTVAPARGDFSTPAVKITYPIGAGIAPTIPLIDISNLDIRPTSTTASSLECLRIDGASTSNISNFSCTGFSFFGLGLAGLKGIVINGTGVSTTEFLLNNIHIHTVDEAIYLTGKVLQGISIANAATISCNICIHVAPSDNNFVMLSMTGITTNAYRASVLLENAPTVLISEGLFNQYLPPRYGNVSSCFEISGQTGVALTTVISNSFCGAWQANQASAATYAVGSLIYNSFGSADIEGITIHDVQFQGGYYGVVASNSSLLSLHDNSCTSSYSTQFAGCIYSIGKNTGSASNNILAGVATSVNVFKDANSPDFIQTTQLDASNSLVVGSNAASTVLSNGFKVVNTAVSATAPTIASGFGTSPSVVSSNGTAAFQVNVGTGGAASSGVITMPAAANGWSCSVADVTTPATNFTKQTASSTTSVTVTNYNTSNVETAWTASDKINLNCVAF